MTYRKFAFFIVVALLTAPMLRAQATEASIRKQLQSLTPSFGPPMGGGMPGGAMPGGSAAPAHVSDADRPATIVLIASEIDSLHAGFPKVRLAVLLTQAATAGQTGAEALQATADTLARTVSETPQPAEKDGLPAFPYILLAKLDRYAGIKTTLKDPQLVKAGELLAANEAEISKTDFTLKDMSGKKVTLSALRGKIVLINFWATECGSCRKEMQDLDLIYTHYQQQGLVVLSITDENPRSVDQHLRRMNYHPQVLIDDTGKVGKEFHIDGVPRTFVLDRDGKLVAESIDMCTQRQFFVMLSKAGLEPNN